MEQMQETTTRKAEMPTARPIQQIELGKERNNDLDPNPTWLQLEEELEEVLRGVPPEVVEQVQTAIDEIQTGIKKSTAELSVPYRFHPERPLYPALQKITPLTAAAPAIRSRINALKTRIQSLQQTQEAA